MKFLKSTLTGVALFFVMLYGTQGFAATDHSGKITTYEGSKTCRVCHEDAVNDVAHALHYRLLGQTQDVYDFLTNKLATGDKGKGNRY
ncbi:MAG: hypothetical protein WCQ99_09305 [Pseudomonadota bacterium]